jgi:hypothetical protein
VAIYRQNIIKYLTDRPGEVVYRKDIENDLELGPTQVTAAILYVQKESPIGREIETVMRGNAWRFTPNRPIVKSTGDGDRDVDVELPLVTLIRQYMLAHPHAPITVNDLVQYTGREPHQVKVGVNNMRRIKANSDFEPYVITIIQGQMWRFEPPPGWRPYGVSAPTSTTTTTVPARQPRSTDAVPPSIDASTDDQVDGVRRFEEVGTAGNTIIIRDGDGNMYRATPLT